MTTRTRNPWQWMVLGCLAAFLTVGCVPRLAVAEDKNKVDIEGLYREGTSDVRIAKNGEVYQVRFDNPDGRRWIGVGLVNGDVLSIAWAFPNGANLGVCSYKVEKGEKGPKLVGHWAAYNDKTPSEDTLIFVSK
jgi:hypothetical protein